MRILPSLSLPVFRRSFLSFIIPDPIIYNDVLMNNFSVKTVRQATTNERR